MPTFFARRYMRQLNNVGTTEKVVGALLLVLVGGIVTLMIVQSITDTNYVFEVDRASYAETPPAHDAAVAAQMLPALDDPRWQPAGDAEAVPPSELTAALGTMADDAAAFGVGRVYRRRYETSGEPAGQLTVTICDAETPAQAFAMWRARQPAGSEPLNVGQDGWSAFDRTGAGFWNGRYYTELKWSAPLSEAPDALASTAKAIAARQLSYGRPFPAERMSPPVANGKTSATGATGDDNPFPHPGVQGWRPPRQIARYTPSNLYEKINGQAAAYLQYGFVSMTFGTYYHYSEPDLTIDVYWYDMGKPENAFGIYRSETSPGTTPISIGNNGYQVGGAVFFWKGTSYVQVLPNNADRAGLQAALAIAGGVADHIDDTGASLWALNALPKDGRVEGSFAYIARDALGQGFLHDVFTIEYNVDGGRITIFIHRAEDEGSASMLLERYVTFFERFGRILWKEPESSPSIVAGDVSGIIDVVFAKGRYLGGVAGAANADVARRSA